MPAGGGATSMPAPVTRDAAADTAARAGASAWTVRLAGAACGAVAWAVFAAAHPLLPESVRAALTLAVFLYGPGAALTLPLLRGAPALDRVTVPLGLGVAAAPAIAQILGLIGLDETFPYLCGALAGAALARRPFVRPGATRAGALCATLAAVALALGAAAQAGRLEVGPAGVTVFGDYDSFDSTYYAAISGELSGTIPPRAPFQSGHSLNYSYFPHLLVGSVHRFAEVPLLRLYFIHAWPLLLAVAAMAGFSLLRRLSTTRVAFTGMLLLLVGSDLSFVVPLVTDTSRVNWDPVIWSTNFFSPGAETLLFNTWTPTLAALFAAFYAFDRYAESGTRGWAAVACAGFAWLVPLKTFAFAAVVGGLALTALGTGRGSLRQRRAAIVMAGTLALAAPYLLDVALGYEDSQAYLTVDLFVIPERLARRLALPALLAPALAPLGLGDAARHAVHLAAAVGVLLIGGLGFRLAGVPALWRAIRHPSADSPAWTLIAWTAVCGAATPFAIATEPYHGTLHFYQTTLFLMPLFVGRTLGALLDRGRPAHWVGAALVFALAAPSTVHYLHRKRGDRARPLTSLDSGGVLIAEYLAHVDPEAVILHRAPEDPSLFTILSGRRTVLAWSRYVRGSADRQRDIAQFFGSTAGDPARAWEVLRTYRVAYVIESRGADAIHPDVVERLRLVIQTPAVVLYAVPAPAGSPGGG